MFPRIPNGTTADSILDPDYYSRIKCEVCGYEVFTISELDEKTLIILHAYESPKCFKKKKHSKVTI